jgi:hypothetical protein
LSREPEPFQTNDEIAAHLDGPLVGAAHAWLHCLLVGDTTGARALCDDSMVARHFAAYVEHGEELGQVSTWGVASRPRPAGPDLEHVVFVAPGQEEVALGPTRMRATTLLMHHTPAGWRVVRVEPPDA